MDWLKLSQTGVKQSLQDCCHVDHRRQNGVSKDVDVCWHNQANTSQPIHKQQLLLSF